MAEDKTYNPAIRRKQGGSVLEVGAGGSIDNYGTITNESTATISNKGTLSSTGTISNAGTLTNSGTLANTGAVTNTGTITNSSDGQIRDSVAANTAAATLNGYGSNNIGSSTAGAREYKLKKPAAAGIHKMLTAVGSSGVLTVIPATGSDACKFNFTKTKITFGANADGVTIDLFAPTSTTWTIVGWSTAWTTTVKCT